MVAPVIGAAWADGLRARAKERDGVIWRQGGEWKYLLHAQTQWRPAGDERLQTRAARQQVSHERSRRRKVFEVVEEQEELSGRQEGAYLLDHQPIHLLAQAQALRDDFWEERGVAQLGESHERDSIEKIAREIVGKL